MEKIEKQFGKKTFCFHKIPAVPAREIILCYGESANIENYERNLDMMHKLLKYVSVKIEGRDELFLTNDDLINNHIEDAKTLLEIEKEEFSFNFDFLMNGEN